MAIRCAFQFVFDCSPSGPPFVIRNWPSPRTMVLSAPVVYSLHWHHDNIMGRNRMTIPTFTPVGYPVVFSPPYGGKLLVQTNRRRVTGLEPFRNHAASSRPSILQAIGELHDASRTGLPPGSGSRVPEASRRQPVQPPHWSHAHGKSPACGQQAVSGSHRAASGERLYLRDGIRSLGCERNRSGSPSFRAVTPFDAVLSPATGNVFSTFPARLRDPLAKVTIAQQFFDPLHEASGRIGNPRCDAVFQAQSRASGTGRDHRPLHRQSF